MSMPSVDTRSSTFTCCCGKTVHVSLPTQPGTSIKVKCDRCTRVHEIVRDSAGDVGAFSIIPYGHECP